MHSPAGRAARVPPCLDPPCRIARSAAHSAREFPRECSPKRPACPPGSRRARRLAKPPVGHPRRAPGDNRGIHTGHATQRYARDMNRLRPSVVIVALALAAPCRAEVAVLVGSPAGRVAREPDPARVNEPSPWHSTRRGGCTAWNIRGATACFGWRPTGLLAGGSIPQVVYGRSHPPSARRSAHGRCPLRVSRAAPPPASCQPRAGTPLRASPPREDSAPQNHLREPRELARVA
jgi:hypothetical protein